MSKDFKHLITFDHWFLENSTKCLEILKANRGSCIVSRKKKKLSSFNKKKLAFLKIIRSNKSQQDAMERS